MNIVDFFTLDNPGHNGNLLQYILNNHFNQTDIYSHQTLYNEYFPTNQQKNHLTDSTHAYHNIENIQYYDKINTFIHLKCNDDASIESAFYNWFFKRRIGNFKNDFRNEREVLITDEKFKEFFVSEFGEKWYTPYSKIFYNYVIKNDNYDKNTFINNLNVAFIEKRHLFCEELKCDNSVNMIKEANYQYFYEIDFHNAFYKGITSVPLLDQYSEELISHQRKNDEIRKELCELFDLPKQVL